MNDMVNDDELLVLMSVDGKIIDWRTALDTENVKNNVHNAVADMLIDLKEKKNPTFGVFRPAKEFVRVRGWEVREHKVEVKML